MFAQFHYSSIVDVQEPAIIPKLDAVDIKYYEGTVLKTQRVAATLGNDINLNQFVLSELSKLPRQTVILEQFEKEATNILSKIIMDIVVASSHKPNRIIVSQNFFTKTFCEWLNIADICSGIEVLITPDTTNLIIVGYKGSIEGDSCLFMKSNVDKIGFYAYNVEKFYRILEIQHVN